MEVIDEFKVVVVDDSDFSRNTITKMIDSPKFNVVGEAANAKDAINLLRDRKAHIAIIDIVMPEISGIELAQNITENFSDISIVMISSLSQENIIIDSISAGASDFLQKPFNKETLMSSLEKIAQTIEQG